MQAPNSIYVIPTTIRHIVNIETRMTTSNKSEALKLKKLLEYMILFKDSLTFLELDYSDDSLTILYLIVLGIMILNIKWIG